MAKPTDVRILRANCATQQIAYRTPMKFGGRVVTDAVLLDVEVEVQSNSGKRAVGFGSMPLGNIWAWPSQSVAAADTLAAMRLLGEALVERASQSKYAGHPLQITTDLASEHAGASQEATRKAGVAEPMPRLAQLVAASPLEAAIYDAYGKVHKYNAYDLLDEEYLEQDLNHWLGVDFCGEWLDRYTLRQPKPTMPLYHLVGALDPLTESDVDTQVDDGLPETLPQWVAADGLTHLKIKLDGADLAWDVDRVASVERVTAPSQAERGCNSWHYSLDFNERCDSVEYVLEFLNLLRETAPAAYDRVQYIEQPTSRNLKAHPENRMHAAAALKPVVIDEALVDLESLLLARELGYTGVALKACKGHSEALLMAAAAQKYGMFLCVQDLTCLGASFLHSASLAARIPTIAAIEGNGRQYCPAGNRGWDVKYPTMFSISDGTVGTGVLTEPGLGFSPS